MHIVAIQQIGFVPNTDWSFQCIGVKLILENALQCLLDLVQLNNDSESCPAPYRPSWLFFRAPQRVRYTFLRFFQPNILMNSCSQDKQTMQGKADDVTH